MRSKTVRTCLLIALILACLILLGKVYCAVPHQLFSQKERSYDTKRVSIYLGGEEITDQCDIPAILEVIEHTSYQKRIFPTGYEAIKIRSELIQIKLKYKISNEDMGWVMWDLYLMPNWQYCTHGSYQWMYSICDGQELYNTIIGMLPE